jgi:hypothetical protein
MSAGTVPVLLVASYAFVLIREIRGEAIFSHQYIPFPYFLHATLVITRK